MLADLQQPPAPVFKVVPLFKRIKPVGQTGAKLKLIRKILQLTKPAIAGVKNAYSVPRLTMEKLSGKCSFISASACV